MTMVSLPAGLQFGYVVGTFLIATGDTAGDVNRLPDFVPARGTVLFSPAVARTAAGASPATIVRRPVAGPLVEDVLHDPAGAPGVWLLAGTYTVDFQIESASLPRITIVVAAEHTLEDPLDLALEYPVPADPAVKFVVNERVYLDTLAARDEAVDAVADADEAVEAAVAAQAPPAVSQAVAGAGIPALAQAAVALHIATYDRTGTGSPEGVVAAPVGTRYRDTAATNGAVLWVKATAAGATGWKVTYGDTGWRRVMGVAGTGTDGLYTDGTGSILYRRVGPQVYARFDGLGFRPDTPARNYVTPSSFIPAGFRAWYSERAAFSLGNAFGSLEFALFIYQASRFRSGAFPPGTGSSALQGTLNFLTDDAWPTTLPGTPA